ncbi:polysaccharide biosynthesis tyrosine autokinase, partial [Brachybacterium hainanense]
MTIEDFLRMLLRNALLIIVVAVIGAAAGIGLSFTQPRVYTASALGYVSASAQIDAEGNPITQASGNMEFQYAKAQSYLPLFNTRAVGQRVVDQLGLSQSADAVAGSLQTTLDPNAPIITVTASAGSPQEASDIANAAVEATAEEALSLETGGNSDAAVTVKLVPYQNALVPGAPVSPDRKVYLAAGLAAGVLLALVIAWIRDRNDSRVRTLKDLAAVTDAPLLGTLPEDKDLSRNKDGRLGEPTGFAAREAIRKLRTNLRYVDVDNPPRSIVVTSSAPGEGKSTVSANLARVMARAGQPTLLIDADLRRPMVAKEFGIDGSVGLAQVLAGAVTLEDAMQALKTRGLSILPAGQVPPNPSELLGSRRMHELIAELSRHYFVIIDAPPVLAVTDAQLLSRHVDGAIIVAVAGRTRVIGLGRAIDAIRGVDGKLYGIVFNRTSNSRLNRIAYGDAEYGYGGYDRYGYSGYGKDGYGGAQGDVDPEGLVPDGAPELEPASPGSVGAAPLSGPAPAAPSPALRPTAPTAAPA